MMQTVESQKEATLPSLFIGVGARLLGFSSTSIRASSPLGVAPPRPTLRMLWKANRRLKRAPSELPDPALLEFAPSASSPNFVEFVLERQWAAAKARSMTFLPSLREESLRKQLQPPKPEDPRLTRGTFIDLPIAPSVGLPDRLTDVKEDEHFSMIQRRSTFELQEAIQKQEGALYIHGPQGFGKSLALYQIFCSLRADPNNRVLYIPSCSSLDNEPYAILFPAIIDAFAEDEALLPTLLPLFHLHLWTNILIEINDYCNSKAFTFYAIFDQYNGLPEPKRRTIPNNLTEWRIPAPALKIIISASANNQEEPPSTSAHHHHYLSKLNPAELAAWCAHYRIPEDPSLSELTENVPFELSCVRRVFNAKKGESFPKVLLEYRAERLQLLHQVHDKYLEQRKPPLPDLKYDTAEHRCMLYMVNELELPIATKLTFDRQLFYASMGETGMRIIPTFPLAKDMVLERIEPLDCDVLAEEVFKCGLTNDAKGRMAEYYIINCLQKSRKICLPDLAYVGGHQFGGRDVNTPIRVERFHGLTVPEKLPPGDLAVLFVPSSGKYPDIDFFLYEPGLHRLLAFQVTVRTEPWYHPSTSKVLSHWKEFCPADTDIIKVWFTLFPLGAAFKPTSDAQRSFLAQCKGDLCLDFSQAPVRAAFPALSHLKLSVV